MGDSSIDSLNITLGFNLEHECVVLTLSSPRDTISFSTTDARRLSEELIKNVMIIEHREV